MNKIFKHCFLGVLFFAIISCGSNKEVNDENLTPIQKQAVTYVKKHLEKGDKLESYQVVEEPLPPAILEQPFLSLRNDVFKAGLDYQSCKTRSLEAGMEMAEQKIETARQEIISTEALLTKNIGDKNSLIVLAKIKTRKSIDGQPQSLIVVFDPETMKATEWIPVTTPVQNTAALIVCAKENTLSEYAKELNHDTQALAPKVSDPVIKFVLDAKAL